MVNRLSGIAKPTVCKVFISQTCVCAAAENGGPSARTMTNNSSPSFKPQLSFQGYSADGECLTVLAAHVAAA